MNPSSRSLTPKLCDITPTRATCEHVESFVALPASDGVRFPMTTHKRCQQLSHEAAALLVSFGLGNACGREVHIMEPTDEMRLDHPGVVLVTGPSGSGKSCLIQARNDIAWSEPGTNGKADRERPIIDAWPTLTITERIERLSTAGLADPFTWARTCDELSVGQRARFDAIDAIYSGDRVIVIDEFLTGLDRPTARAVAWAIGKIIRKKRKVLVAATSLSDIAEDLVADVIVRVNWTSKPDIERPAYTRSQCTLLDEIYYEPASVAAWHRVRSMHYAAGDPGTYHSVHTLRHPSMNDPVAVAVLSYPALACAARNVATKNEYSGKSSRAIAQRLNREVLLLSRIVVTPEFRCAGLATLLIREIISRTTARWIECSTSMGKYNRFLANAGFVEAPQASGPSEAALQAWAIERHVPPHVALDVDGFIAWVDALSVRHRREARRIVWAHYHQFVIHRRTNKAPPKKVPPHHDAHWRMAFDFASRRLIDRPSYWIYGPIDAHAEHGQVENNSGVRIA